MANNCYRFIEIKNSSSYRSEYQRDYARVLHSPAFRRLVNKAQLFPGYESDYFRNRLTHSLEVAQIAKSIGFKLNKENNNLNIEPIICEIAGLMHDLGHPPFGHNGEMALDMCMKNCGGFEGNAQTLRIITRLEKKEEPSSIDYKNDNRVGLNLTARVIASALKYDTCIPLNNKKREKPNQLVKGYYITENDIIEKVKSCLVNKSYNDKFKTVECSIMDLADDIAYSTYDIEDAFKGGFLTPYDMMSADDHIINEIIERLKNDNINTDSVEVRGLIAELFGDVWEETITRVKSISKTDPDYNSSALACFVTSYDFSKKIACDGFKRIKFTSFLVNQFINGIKFDYNDAIPLLSKIYFDDKTKKIVNILKHFAYVVLIKSANFKVCEHRGRDIITKIFNKINKNPEYLPNDFRLIYDGVNTNDGKKRVICDFIAGMTDRYALEFYCRLFSENPQTIFKPIT